MPTPPASTVVAVQHPAIEDPREGHLGPGLLIAPSKVLVNGDLLLKIPRRTVVVIGDAEVGRSCVERHVAQPFPDGRRTVLRAEGHDRIALGILQLDSASAHPTVEPDLEALQASLDRPGAGGGPWRHLRPMVPDGIESLPDSRWLAAVGGREPPDIEVEVPFGVLPGWICFLEPWCDPTFAPFTGPVRGPGHQPGR